MQAPDDLALAAAVAAPVRSPLARLTVDWARDNGFNHALSDLSGVLDSVTVERSITGDLPAECSLVEGYTTATMTATLSGTRPGDPRDIARMVSPYRTDSPLHRQPQVDVPVRCDLGLGTTAGPRLLRQFTGTTRSLRVSAATRTLTVDVLDPAERLRAAVTLPVAATNDRTYYTPTTWPYLFRVNTQWLLDFVLRRNGIFFSPPPRPGCLWAMTGHGGLVPDVGSQGVLIIGRRVNNAPQWTPGAYGLAVNATTEVYAYGGARAINWFRLGYPGVGHLAEFHIKAGASNTFHSEADGTVIEVPTNYFSDGATVRIGVTTTGQLRARVYNSGTLALTVSGPTITGPAAWHAVGCWFTYDATAKTFTHRWRLDGTVTSAATATLNLTSLVTLPRASVTWYAPLPVQCLQLAEAAAIPAGWGTPHVSQADIDTGLNWMTALPNIVNGDSWEVIKKAVAAEYGLVSFTEDGRFRFLTRDTARTNAAGPSVKTITAATSLTDLEVGVALDSVRNEITHTHAPVLERDVTEIVYQPATVEELDARQGTSTRTVTLSGRCGASETFFSYTAATFPDATDFSGFVATNASTGAAVSNVTVTGLLSDDQATMELTFVNPNTFTVRFQIQNRPAFRIVGNPVTADHPRRVLTTNPTSIARYGRRVLDLPDNEFRHHPDSAAAVAASLLADLAEPVPILAEVPVVGDPRVQLADVVTLDDPTGIGGPITGSVIALRRALSTDDGLADWLTLRARPPA